MTEDLDVKTAIQNGDVAALRGCLVLDRSRANALIHWGNNNCVRTHPLHFVSDMLFNGVLQKGKELPLIEALLDAGACVDFRKQGKLTQAAPIHASMAIHTRARHIGSSSNASSIATVGN